MANSDGSTQYDEWKAARDLIGAYDGQIHNLRQWGFTFITSLLTAQALLLPSFVVKASGTSSGSGLTDQVKLGILAITLVIIVALRQVEKVYQIYQKAANFRALILERSLNIELGTIITDRYARFHMSRRITAIYLAFIAADAGLGLVVISNQNYSHSLLLFAIATAVLVGLVGRADLHFERGERSDWTFDKLWYISDETMTITLANQSDGNKWSRRKSAKNATSKEAIKFPPGNAVLAFRKSSKGVVAEEGIGIKPDAPKPKFVRTQSEVSVEPMNYYSWSVDTKDLGPGTYQVFPTVAKQVFLDMMEKSLYHTIKHRNDEKTIERLTFLAAHLGFKTPEMMKGTNYERWVYPVALAREVTIADSGKSTRHLERTPPSATKAAQGAADT